MALGELLSDLVNPVARMRDDQTECQSTEEIIYKIREANEELLKKEVNWFMVGSMDIGSLYTSIRPA